MNIEEEYKATRQQLFDKAGIQPNSLKVRTTGPVKNVHYLEMGTGKPLIIVHGGGGFSSEWINILEPLSRQYHLYVVDRPGHGQTDPFNYRGVNLPEHATDFFDSFMKAVGLESALFLANSMGGYFSIRFAMRHPEKVEKLVLIGAPAGMNRWIPFMLRLLGTKGINKLLINTVAKPSVSGAKKMYEQLLVEDIDKIDTKFFEHCYYHQLLPGNTKGFRTLLENVLTLNGWKKSLYIGDRLQELDVPVRFIWGSEDAFEKPESGKQKASSIKDYQFEVVENAGHCPWLEKPEECVSLILSMLKE